MCVCVCVCVFACVCVCPCLTAKERVGTENTLPILSACPLNAQAYTHTHKHTHAALDLSYPIVFIWDKWMRVLCVCAGIRACVLSTHKWSCVTSDGTLQPACFLMIKHCHEGCWRSLWMSGSSENRKCVIEPFKAAAASLSWSDIRVQANYLLFIDNGRRRCYSQLLEQIDSTELVKTLKGWDASQLNHSKTNKHGTWSITDCHPNRAGLCLAIN